MPPAVRSIVARVCLDFLREGPRTIVLRLGIYHWCNSVCIYPQSIKDVTVRRVRSTPCGPQLRRPRLRSRKESPGYRRASRSVSRRSHFRSRRYTPPPGKTVKPACISLPPHPEGPAPTYFATPLGLPPSSPSLQRAVLVSRSAPETLRSLRVASDEVVAVPSSRATSSSKRSA